MPTGRDRDGRLAGRLHAARTSAFVGRQVELDLFRAALEAPLPEFAVLAVHGPGGVGKSALLGRYAHVATDAGRPVVLIDGRDVDPTPTGLGQAIADQLDVPADQALAALADFPAPVLLIDTYEDLAHIDDWLRTRLVPTLSDRALVVLAGRRAPGPAWHRDPGWDQLLRTIALRDLPADQARQLLQLRGVDPTRHDEILALVRGHPLALVLVADVIDEHDPATLTLGDTPEVLEGLLDRLVRDLPDRHHRDVLHATAIAGTATESLLRDVLGEPHARPLFDWLTTLSIARPTPTGIALHDLASDTLATELRWRDPDGYLTTFHLVADHLQDTVLDRTGPGRERAMLDLFHLYRRNPITGPFLGTPPEGTWMEPATSADHEAILAMTRDHEGEASAATAAHWLQEQPDAFTVFRTARTDTAAGFAAHLTLGDTPDAATTSDPVLAAVWAHVRAHGPLRQGERIRVMRFWVGADAHETPATFPLVAARATVDYITTVGLAWAFGVVTEPHAYDPMFTFAGFHRTDDVVLDHEVVGMFARDMRQLSLRDWWNLLADRIVSDSTTTTRLPQASRRRLVLAEGDFAAAVRDALRNAARPGGLDDNPLLRSRVVLDAADDRPAPQVLADLLRRATAELAHHPRDAKSHRALDRTYFRPAPTQEAAAEVLDLPFSTYRRHLAAGIDHVIEYLWARELHGHGDQDERPGEHESGTSRSRG